MYIHYILCGRSEKCAKTEELTPNFFLQSALTSPLHRDKNEKESWHLAWHLDGFRATLWLVARAKHYPDERRGDSGD